MGFYHCVFLLDTQFHWHKKIRLFIQEAGILCMPQGQKAWEIRDGILPGKFSCGEKSGEEGFFT